MLKRSPCENCSSLLRVQCGIMNMVNYAVFCFTIFFATTLSSPPPSVSKRYRSDYEYNERTDAFYKLHTESRRGWRVNSVCQVEGASIMVPATNEDIVQVHGMFKRYPDLNEHLWVASDGHTHESAEEPAIINLSDPDEDNSDRYVRCNVLSRKGVILEIPCYHELPFVCKVEAKNAPYDSHCDLFANNYIYNATVGSCYSIPRRIASWSDAYSECRREGAHLVVLNSEAERAVVRTLMQDTPSVEGAQASWFFFAGFRANKPVGNETVVFRTIFNETLAEAGFAVWSPGEPNNAAGKEFCGTLFKNDGLLNDVYCEHEYAFICEKEIRAQS